jgi:hypothetical protein
MLSGMLGLSGFTSTLCSWGRRTRSMSSIGIAANVLETDEELYRRLA